MVYYPPISWEEFNQRSDMQFLRCGEDCGNYDRLNRCCWLSWWHKEPGDSCDYNLVIGPDMMIFELVNDEDGAR